ncbi:hypothetical protein TVAGG3_0900840, partial [Trichomonas vaginalis G3]|uniref:hypothetical protein n=1 Tax=Trichomonas vaginalis (strain ATCC PRA-98 / G3) TaxID=412133 RepID=UPI0021E537B7
NLPVTCNGHSTRELPNSKSLVTDMTKMNTLTSSETTVQNGLTAIRLHNLNSTFSNSTQQPIYIIALTFPNNNKTSQMEMLLLSSMETPEQFGKKKSLIAKFVPGHQLFQRTEVFCIPGTKFFVRGELKERYNVSFNYTLYNVFDQKKTSSQKQWRRKKRRRNTNSIQEESSEFTTRRL